MLKITEPGKYLLSAQAVNTDSSLDLDGMEVDANRWGSHPTGDIRWEAGLHTFSLTCPCAGKGNVKLILRWQRPGKDKFEDIDAGSLLHVEAQ